ncbi:alpha/beta hydrolase, partial [Singulisphaera rosea]
MSKARLSRVVGPSALTMLLLGLATVAFGDKVVLKNGVMYRGSVDRDNTIVWVFDGLKRVVLRDSKIAKFDPDSTFGNWENFRLQQPLVKHAGMMPKEAFDIKISPWNDRGRRSFSYVSARSTKPVSMEQAIYEMGPYLVKLRGVDGFWQEGRLSTTQVPREVVVGLLGKVERTNLNERRRVASFLIQAGWYDEANAELDALGHEFPDEPGLNDTLASAHAVVSQLFATQRKAEIEVRRQGQQYREVAKLLKSFPTKDVSADILVDVRDQIRKDDAQAATDKALTDDLRALADRLPSEAKTEWKTPMLEFIRALTEVPDVARDRFVAWQKAKAESNGKDEALFALAMSGFVVGPDAAVPDLSAASTIWKMRSMLQDYLAGDATTRTEVLEQLQSLTLPPDSSQAGSAQRLDLLS